MKVFLHVVLPIILVLSLGTAYSMSEDDLIRGLNANGCEAKRLSLIGEHSHYLIVDGFSDFPGARGTIDMNNLSVGKIVYWYATNFGVHELNVTGLDTINIIDIVGPKLAADRRLRSTRSDRYSSYNVAVPNEIEAVPLIPTEKELTVIMERAEESRREIEV